MDGTKSTNYDEFSLKTRPSYLKSYEGQINSRDQQNIKAHSNPAGHTLDKKSSNTEVKKLIGGASSKKRKSSRKKRKSSRRNRK
jgi:hypothetical protein